MTALRKRAEKAASNLLRRPDEWPDPRWEQERNRIADAIEAEAKRFAERALQFALYGKLLAEPYGDGPIAEAIAAAEGDET
jgi:hypothetical protein